MAKWNLILSLSKDFLRVWESPAWKATCMYICELSHMCKVMSKFMSAYVFFFEPVTPSVSVPARLSDHCSAHCHQVHFISLSVSLQASWVRGLLHAGCGNHNTHALHAHAAENMVECLRRRMSIKGNKETSHRKKMEKESCSSWVWNVWHVHWDF